MSEALSALTSHYDRLRGQSYTVPGVTKADGTPLVIHFNPPTNADAQRIQARAGMRDEAKVTLYTVIYLARDEHGSPLFEDNAATVQALTENVPGRVLSDIARQIMSFSTPADLGN